MSVFSSVLSYFHDRWFFPRMCGERKGKIQFLFRLDLNTVKQLWCHANIQMFSAVSLMVHLHSKNFVVLIDAVVLCGHKIFSVIAITVSVHQRHTRIKLWDHQFVCRLHKFVFGLLRRWKNNWHLLKGSWPRRKYVNVRVVEIIVASHGLF